MTDIVISATPKRPTDRIPLTYLRRRLELPASARTVYVSRPEPGDEDPGLTWTVRLGPRAGRVYGRRLPGLAVSVEECDLLTGDGTCPAYCWTFEPDPFDRRDRLASLRVVAPAALTPPYATVSTVVAGALETEDDIPSPRADAAIERQRRALQRLARRRPELAPVLTVTWHPHPPLPGDPECACAQFADSTDVYTFSETGDDE